MKRDNLDFLDEEQKDKVMALYGKAVSKKDTEIETLKSEKKDLEDKIGTYETKINEFNESAKENAEWKTKFEELQTTIKEQEAKKKAEEEDKILTDIKDGLNKPENKSKGVQDLFNELTKDKEGIFANDNQIKDMPSMGDSEQDNNTKEIPTIW